MISSVLTSSARSAVRSVSTIAAIHGRQVFDCRGIPTVEVSIMTQDGIFRASVPSSDSSSSYESVEVRDGGEDYAGKGVSTAVSNIMTRIAPKIIGVDVMNQRGIDEIMIQLDGTTQKGALGANAMLAVSLAVSRAGAVAARSPLYRWYAELMGTNSYCEYVLPVPAMNMLSGDARAANRLPFKEFLIFPTGACCFKNAMMIGTDVYRHLSLLLQRKYGLSGIHVNEDGAFTPPMDSAEEALDAIMEAVEKSGHAKSVKLGIDCDASQLYKKENDNYDLAFKTGGGDIKSKEELTDYYLKLAHTYPITFIEDPFDKEDWDSFVQLTAKVQDQIEILGDKLLASHPQRVATAAKEGACNGMVVKVNQQGTLLEFFKAARDAKKNGWGLMVSHRMADTEETYLADLAVGTGAGQIKCGAPCRSERVAKYNQLLRIEEEVGEMARYAGLHFRYP